MTNTPETRKVQVTWHTTTDATPHTTTVLLVAGYSTEADIPTIIAIRWHGAAPASTIVIDSTEAVA